MLDALDCPLPSLKTPKRPVTTTALQALSLMNNEFVQQQAAALAQRLTGESGGNDARITRGFQLTFGRSPDDEELTRSRMLIERNGLDAFCWGLFNATEFIYIE